MQVIEKPWGKEELIEINDRYMVKRLSMWKGHRCSLQYHTMKRETIYLLSGRLKVFYGVSPEKLECTVYGPGEYLTLAPTMVHRMEAEENCIYLEASTPEMMDVVRLDDDYRRAVS